VQPVTQRAEPTRMMFGGGKGDGGEGGFMDKLKQAQEMLIQIPIEPDAPYEIFAVAKDAWHANARSYLFLDAYSGKTLSLRPYEQLGIGSKIYFTAISLHTGMPFGILGQLILFLSALALTLVIYSGFASFIRSKRNKPATTNDI
jgi:uncharacterized iron-regulated membrane protein